MSKDRFNPADYRRFSDRKRDRELSDEDRRKQLLDFIKTNLVEVLYNQYAQNETNKDYIKLIDCIDKKIMPELAYLFERYPDEAQEKIEQARNDLLKPITEAFKRGDKLAEFVLSGSRLKHINPSKYKAKTKNTLMQNITLLKEIDQNTEDQNIELLERNGSILIGKLSRASIDEDDILELFNDLDLCKEFISIKRENSSLSQATSASTINSLDEAELRETPPISTFSTITPISSQEDELKILHPEKYSNKITSALNIHSNIVGEINLAICSRDLEGLQSSGKKLMRHLKGVLDKNERDEIREDMNRMYKDISAQQEAINAVRPIVNLAHTQNISPERIDRPTKAPRHTKSEGRS